MRESPRAARASFWRLFARPSQLHDLVVRAGFLRDDLLGDALVLTVEAIDIGGADILFRAVVEVARLRWDGQVGPEVTLAGIAPCPASRVEAPDVTDVLDHCSGWRSKCRPSATQAVASTT